LDTGATTLAFASHELGKSNFKNGYVAASASEQPLGIEIALVTPDVFSAHQQAIDAGAVDINPLKPSAGARWCHTSDVQMALWLRFVRRLVSERLAVAAAISLFGFNSGAALATVVGVLIEVPVMLSVVKIVNSTQRWYEAGPRVGAKHKRTA